jgi:hypothetical protein
VTGASLASRSQTIFPLLVWKIAVYFLEVSILMAGGSVYCFRAGCVVWPQSHPALMPMITHTNDIARTLFRIPLMSVSFTVFYLAVSLQ